MTENPATTADALETEGAAEETAQSSALDALDELNSEVKVRLMAEAADAVRAEEIAVLDLRELTIIADYFLICTGKSSIQLRAIADRIEEKLREIGLRKLRVEGYQEATWILMDYGDVVAHIMAAEQRAYYDLEAFWSEANRLELDLKSESTTIHAPQARFDTLMPPEEAYPDEVEEDTL